MLESIMLEAALNLALTVLFGAVSVYLWFITFIHLWISPLDEYYEWRTMAVYVVAAFLTLMCTLWAASNLAVSGGLAILFSG